MKRRAYTALELVIAVAILALSVALLFPRGQRSKDRLSSEVVAKELMSRLRQVRQAALARRVPVALAIPRSATAAYSDTAYTVEGDFKPGAPGKIWKIEQDAPRVVFFVGRWGGPSWASLPPSPLFQDWWTVPPVGTQPYFFAFTPQGKLESNAETADGAYRILVAQGVSEAGGSLRQADSPWTVWLRPDGEVGLDRGIWAADQAYASPLRESVGGASLVTGATPNHKPHALTVKALPNNQNPNTAKGNLMDCGSCLTLEVRAQDEDGDTPYFHWKTVAVGEVNGSGDVTADTMTSANQGRFGNSGSCRMEWSTQTREWVGRTSWTPAPGDRGGRGYQLECEVQDRPNSSETIAFPVQGWLQTTRESWVLYKALTRNNRWELWKMTLEGKNHQRVVGIPGQDIVFGQWTADGDELVLATANQLYRANADGSGLRLISPAGAAPIESCCVSPDGRFAFYVGGSGDNKQHHRIELATNGQETDVAFKTNQPFDNVYNLSSAVYSGRVVLLENFYRTYQKLEAGPFGPTLRTYHRDGVLVTDGFGNDGGDDSGTDPAPPTLAGVGQSRTTTGGASLSADGQSVLWGRGSTVYVAPVTPPSGPVSSFALGPARTIAASAPDVHHPRFTPDRKGLVFASGRGAASRLYYIPDVDNPVARVLTLPPENLCGDEPTVTRPR